MKSNSNKLWGEFWVHSPRWIYINQSSYHYHFSIFGLSGSCCCCCCWRYQPSPPPWVLFSLTMFHLSAPSISFWNGQPGDLFQDVEEKLPNQARLLLQVSASLSLSSLSGPVVCTTSRGSILWDPNLSLSCHRQSFSWPLCYRGWGLIRFVVTWKKTKNIAVWKFDEVSGQNWKSQNALMKFHYFEKLQTNSWQKMVTKCHFSRAF